MNDRSISFNQTVTAALWTLAGMLMVAVWVTWAVGHDGLSRSLGLCLVPVCTLAGVSQVRGGQLRACSLLRTMAGFGANPRDAELHSIR